MLVLTAALTLAAGLPPNFILLMSDDTGWGDVSYNNVSSRIHSEYLRVHVDFACVSDYVHASRTNCHTLRRQTLALAARRSW